MIEAETPTLWDIRQRLGHPAAVAILVNAFVHAAKLVNLDKNITIEQIGEAANDTLEIYGYLKVEEVKYLLKRAMRTQNVYGRLDYNVLMNWVRQYDNERTEEAMRLSDQKASEEENAPVDRPGAVSFRQYLDQLRQRAETDPQAADLLATCDRIQSTPSSADRSKRDHDFKMWRTFKYLSGNKE